MSRKTNHTYVGVQVWKSVYCGNTAGLSVQQSDLVHPLGSCTCVQSQNDTCSKS